MSITKLQVYRGGKLLGEFTYDQIAAEVAAGSLHLSDYFWQEGKDRWVRLSELFAQPHGAKSEEDERTVNSRNLEEELRKERTETSSFSCDVCSSRFDQVKTRRANPALFFTYLIVGLLLMIPDSKFWNTIAEVLLIVAALRLLIEELSFPHCPICNSPNIKSTNKRS